MTSDGGYPGFMDDAFGPILDSYRCTDDRPGRRCQLYVRYNGDHAAATLEQRYSRRAGRSWRISVIRWGGEGEPRVAEQVDPKLRWCCMFRT